MALIETLGQLVVDDIDRDCCRNRVDLKPLPKVERFQNDAVLSVVKTAKLHRFEYDIYFRTKFALFDSKWRI